MPYVEVYIEAEDVLEDLDDNTLMDELKKRDEKNGKLRVDLPANELGIRAWRELRKGNIGQYVRDYFWLVHGKIL